MPKFTITRFIKAVYWNHRLNQKFKNKNYNLQDLEYYIYLNALKSYDNYHNVFNDDVDAEIYSHSVYLVFHYSLLVSPITNHTKTKVSRDLYSFHEHKIKKCLRKYFNIASEDIDNMFLDYLSQYSIASSVDDLINVSSKFFQTYVQNAPSSSILFPFMAHDITSKLSFILDIYDYIVPHYKLKK